MTAEPARPTWDQIEQILNDMVCGLLHDTADPAQIRALVTKCSGWSAEWAGDMFVKAIEFTRDHAGAQGYEDAVNLLDEQPEVWGPQAAAFLRNVSLCEHGDGLEGHPDLIDL